MSILSRVTKRDYTDLTSYLFASRKDHREDKSKQSKHLCYRAARRQDLCPVYRAVFVKVIIVDLVNRSRVYSTVHAPVHARQVRQ